MILASKSGIDSLLSLSGREERGVYARLNKGGNPDLGMAPGKGGTTFGITTLRSIPSSFGFSLKEEG